MTGSPDKAWTDIADITIAVDKALTSSLMTIIRDNEIHNRTVLYDPVLHTPIKAHDHDRLNSAAVAGASKGVQLVSCDPFSRVVGDDFGTDLTNFQAAACILSGQWHVTATEAAIKIGAAAGTDMAGNTSSSLPTDAFDQFGGVNFGVAAANSFGGDAFAQCNAMIFGDKAGFIKTGTYTGDGSGSNPVTGIGFAPDIVIIMRVNFGQPTIRTKGFASTNSRETDGVWSTNSIISLDSDGFTVGANANVNSNTDVFHYLAIKEGNFDGEKVEIVNYSGNLTQRDITGTFTPQACIILSTTDTGSVGPRHKSRAMDNTVCKNWAAAGNATDIRFMVSNGVQISNSSNVNNSGQSYDALFFSGGTIFAGA